MKKHYTRVIYWSEEDGKYLGELPEFSAYPVARGKTLEEVSADLDDAEESFIAALGDNLPERGVRVIASSRRRNWAANSKVAQLRAKTGLSQKDFAAFIGASISALQKWESGERTPSGSAARLLELIEQRPELIVAK